MDVPQSPETNSQVEPGRVEVAVQLGDLMLGGILEYLKRHQLQVKRFGWDKDGRPVLYCEHKQQGG